MQEQPLHKEIFHLNEAQAGAVRAPMGPLLIVAGAGTGKTRALTSRIVHFIEQGIRPERICAITFTNKAAKEMVDRVLRMMPREVSTLKQKTPFLGTFHSLGARILRKECRAFDRSPDFSIFDDHDSFDVMKKILKPASDQSDEKVDKKKTPAFFVNEVSRAKNLDLVAGEPLGSANSFNGASISSVMGQYESILKENNAFDFDDLIEKVVALFKKEPRVLQKYQAMFDAVLVDEYQDINPKQHEFVKLLASGHRNLSVVGDDEQTIYGWRYADIGIFLNFEREWPGAKVYFLEENYRSTGTIIDAAAAVSKNNRLRAPKNLFTKNDGGDPISLFEAWSEGDESERIAHEVRESKFLKKGESVGILYRTNAQSRAIEQSLIRRDIPYRIFGGLKFYERREIKDIVAGLRYAANPKDVISRERLQKNLTKKKFATFQTKLNEIKDSAEFSPTGIITAFIDSYDYSTYLAAHFTNIDERQENIAELISFASSFNSLSEFIEKLSLLQSTDDENRASERGAGSPMSNVVNLMTIHLAKGLEFDHVFLIGVSEGVLPHVRSMDKESQIEEERRLMYVAMTRARKTLFISFYGMPSRFISEIPENLIRLVKSYDNNNTEAKLDDLDDERVIYY